MNIIQLFILLVCIPTHAQGIKSSEDSSFIGSYLEPQKILNIIEQDVISFYDLSNTYDTPLKIKMFFNSEDGKEKTEYVKAGLRFVFQNGFFLNNFDLKRNIENYDVKKKTFKIQLSNNYAVGGHYARYNNNSDVEILISEKVWVSEKFVFHNKENSYLQFKVLDESEALNIENGFTEGAPDTCLLRYRVVGIKRIDKSEKALEVDLTDILFKFDGKLISYKPMSKSTK